jgi:hypothetical protein
MLLPGASGAILEERQGGLCHHHHWEGAEPADSLRLWWDEMHSDYSQQNDGTSQ